MGSALGDNAMEFIDKLLTPEEMEESNKRVAKMNAGTITPERKRDILRGLCILILMNNITNIAQLYIHIEKAPDDVFDVFTQKSAFLGRMCEAISKHPWKYKSEAQKLIDDGFLDDFDEE